MNKKQIAKNRRKGFSSLCRRLFYSLQFSAAAAAIAPCFGDKAAFSGSSYLCSTVFADKLISRSKLLLLLYPHSLSAVGAFYRIAESAVHLFGVAFPTFSMIQAAIAAMQHLMRQNLLYLLFLGRNCVGRKFYQKSALWQPFAAAESAFRPAVHSHLRQNLFADRYLKRSRLRYDLGK